MIGDVGLCEKRDGSAVPHHIHVALPECLIFVCMITLVLERERMSIDEQNVMNGDFNF